MWKAIVIFQYGNKGWKDDMVLMLGWVPAIYDRQLLGSKIPLLGPAVHAV